MDTSPPTPSPLFQGGVLESLPAFVVFELPCLRCYWSLLVPRMTSADPGFPVRDFSGDLYPAPSPDSRLCLAEGQLTSLRPAGEGIAVTSDSALPLPASPR